MRIRTAEGRPALLTYCANVHPGETLADVLDMASRFAGPVRCRLEAPEMGLGLWLSRAALTELRAEGLNRLRDALADEGLFTFTLNGFPYGNFQAEVVKRRVYHPDCGTDERRTYLRELAEVLSALLPDDLEAGTISTLPLGHREEADPDLETRALDQLCRLALELAELRDRTGKSIRVCLEPEPGCLIETTPDAVRFFTEALPEAARRHGVPAQVWQEHLGLCFDACHQAVAFEDAAASLRSLRAAGVVVGKAQLSSALVVHAPGSAEARRRLSAFDEPRFLHQVRARRDDGALAGRGRPARGRSASRRPALARPLPRAHPPRRWWASWGPPATLLAAALAELRTWDHAAPPRGRDLHLVGAARGRAPARTTAGSIDGIAGRAALGAASRWHDGRTRWSSSTSSASPRRCSAPDTPHLNALVRDGFLATLNAVLPAVTCTAQATLLTGLLPRDHGIVANGWYFRDLGGGLALAPVEPPGGGREGVGEPRASARPGFRVRQDVLVVQHVFLGGYLGHAAADLSRRRAQAARPLLEPAGASGRAGAASRPVPAVQLLGPGRRHPLHRLDRAGFASTSSRRSGRT